jgi:hypothetical protein
MLEVGQRLERGRGCPPDERQAVEWYRKAVRAGNLLAPAVVGECVFETSPVEGMVWLMLAFERADDGAPSNAALARALTIYEPRLNDRAIAAASVWADRCREGETWPDETSAPNLSFDPFQTRPPPPKRPLRIPTDAAHLAQEVCFGPWRVLIPSAATIDADGPSQHLAASWDSCTLNLTWATLRPGVSIDRYVFQETTRHTGWTRPSFERFVLRGVDSHSTILDDARSQERALLRFACVDEQVATVAILSPAYAFQRHLKEFLAIADSLTFAAKNLT